MARKKTEVAVAAPLPEVNTQAYVEDVIAVRTVADIQRQDEMDEVLAAGVDLGRLEALDFVATVANSALIQIFENVKKSKAWRLLRNPKSGDGRHFESIDEFCEAKLGKSYRRMREIASNHRLLGQEAFEQAERIGLHQRDYNAIKALPAPDQELIRRAVEEAKTRDEVVDLMQELAVRHGKEREAHGKELEDAKAEQRALEKLSADAAKEKQRLQVKLEKLQLGTASWEDKVAEFKEEIGKRQAIVDEALGRHLEAATALDAWWTEQVTSRDGYDPEMQVDLPVPVLTVLMQLVDAVDRSAQVVAAVQADLHNRFGQEIDQFRSHRLADSDEGGSDDDMEA
ncbi:hypothetical protein [Pigmentiphaga kullae]|uniref:Uncharacterized protein n=1 Tax=Pigmentiphaga kullae TaxID=151784 RepID=A0A4Q7NMD2_9BURK|nr:hypothetical protein [Pigmentiphaga kullae]RZS86046.1 hypothetical protein EV675_2080 [Pigmentiphaga kullae]